MINKIYRRLNNKYSNIIKFFFFLRYVFLIFFVSISLFLTIPKFFDYEKKKSIIKEHLYNEYELELISYSSIQFKIFPQPNITLQNIQLQFKNRPINLDSQNISIFLNLNNIYNYKNFKSKKIKFLNNQLFIDIDKISNLVNYLTNLKYKLEIKSLTLNLKSNKVPLIKIKNINFLNYGFKKYHITGNIFDKKFKASLTNNGQNLNFKILKTGISANFKLSDKKDENFLLGSSSISLLNNILKFDFKLNDGQLEINKSNFRNKNLSFSLDSIIKFNPFFSTKSEIHIDTINKNLIESLPLDALLENREIIKKLSSKIYINYKNKNFFSNLIETYSSDINLANGRIDFRNIIKTAGGEISCKCDSLLTDIYPRLNFVCFFNFKDKKKLFKKFSISKRINNNVLNFDIEGNLNILNNKINFKKINNNNGYSATKEDLKYFKEEFEDILFNKNFFNIFKKNKIKKFILEII